MVCLRSGGEEPAARWVELEGLDNVRDVGGLPLVDGGTTRSGVLLRSASLHYATAADVEHLVDRFGLRLVLDLRTQREIDRDGPTPIAAAGVETVALSFIPEDEPTAARRPATTPTRCCAATSATSSTAPRTSSRPCAGWPPPDTGPTLVHCAAGKDRTGVLVAIVLDVVGVRREAVVADYALSAERVEALFRRWTAARGADMPAR